MTIINIILCYTSLSTSWLVTSQVVRLSKVEEGDSFVGLSHVCVNMIQHGQDMLITF